MKTYPLHSISLEQAKQLQFKVIDAVTRNFQGEEVLSLGDLGVVKGLNKPTPLMPRRRCLCAAPARVRSAGH